MLLFSLLIIGHVEIGNGICRTDMMLDNEVVSMEYPCEYYSELRDWDKKLNKPGE